MFVYIPQAPFQVFPIPANSTLSNLQHDSRHFYCVTSNQTSTTYHPKTHANPYVLESNYPFSWQDVCPEAIEQHLNAADSHATYFISVFARFGTYTHSLHLLAANILI